METYSKFARTAMAKMGWSEGKGLGKKENGISKHVSVQKRQLNAGLGMEAAEPKFAARSLKGAGKSSVDVDGHWWSDAFGAALENVNKRSAKTATLDEIFEASGGTRLGMRARREQPGKLRRIEAADGGIKKTNDEAGLAQKERDEAAAQTAPSPAATGATTASKRRTRNKGNHHREASSRERKNRKHNKKRVSS